MLHPRSLSLLLAFALLAPAPLLAGDGEEADEKKLKAGDRDPAFLQKVNDSIRRGVEYVLSEQEEEGCWGYSHAKDNWDSGCTALALLALLKSGVNRYDKAVEKGFGWLRKQPFQKTYSTALTIMAVEARWRDSKVADQISQEKTRAVFRRPKMPPRDLEWIKEAVRFLLDNIEYSERRTVNGTMVTKRDAWSYPRNPGQDAADHSNTQYALLGLKAASRCGVRLPKEPFALCLEHFLKFQEETGPKVMRVRMIEDREHGYVSYKPVSRVLDTARGWTYSGGVKPAGDSGQHPTATTGSMTSVGVASIIICLSELGPRDVNAATRSKAQKAVLDGLAWLTHRFTVEKNPGHPNGGWLYYYLYGLERAAVLAGSRNLGRHDWYREGAEFLMRKQSGKGGWTYKASCGLLPSSCLALLFLTKATVPVRVKITGH